MSKTSVIKGKGSWTPEEDAILRDKRALYGRKWAKIASHLPGRQGKQCRERYVNHLDPNLKKGEWTDDEEAILIASHQRNGNRWAVIAKELPGRSDNDVKNHWYSTIQRKFQMHGKDVSATDLHLICLKWACSISHVLIERLISPVIPSIFRDTKLQKLTSAAMKQVQMIMKERSESAPPAAAPAGASYSQATSSYPPHPYPPYPPPYGHFPLPPNMPHGYPPPPPGYGYAPFGYSVQQTPAMTQGRATTGSAPTAPAQSHGRPASSPEDGKEGSRDEDEAGGAADDPYMTIPVGSKKSSPGGGSEGHGGTGEERRLS